MFIDEAQPWWLFLCLHLDDLMLENYRKPALTFDQQLDRLQDRGLIIDDRTFALSKLKAISYFRLSAYSYPFRIRDEHSNVSSNFIPGTNFSEIIKLYEFDRHLRLIVMDAIEKVEVYIRTLLAYHLGHTYGTFGHTDASNFHPKFDHMRWHEKIEEEAERSNDTFIKHYKRKYSGFPVLPIWMAAEVMSLGSLSFGYEGMKNDEKRMISQQLGLHHNRLADWLHKLTYIRNVCAHHNRLWNRALSIRPEAVRDPVWNPPITPRNNRIFFILLMLRYLLKTMDDGDNWRDQCTDLIEPIAQERRWRVAMGVPENWKKHPIWN